jgi:hypothetical protein
MAKTVSLNYTDTAGGVAPTLTGVAKNYGADFAKKLDSAGQAVITNITSPSDAPNTEIYACRVVKDVYRGTPVTESYKSPNKSGFSLLSQCNLVATILDSEDSTYRVDVPLKVGVTVAGTLDGNITTAHYTTALMRAIGGLYETTGALRLSKLVRGSLLPADM